MCSPDNNYCAEIAAHLFSETNWRRGLRTLRINRSRNVLKYSFGGSVTRFYWEVTENSGSNFETFGKVSVVTEGHNVVKFCVLLLYKVGSGSLNVATLQNTFIAVEQPAVGGLIKCCDSPTERF
jgi:hypothetical protein